MNTDPTPRNPRAARSALFRSLLAVSLGLLLAVAATAADAAKKSFDLPAGDAFATLKQFMSQAEARLLYSVDAIKDVQTNAVKGDLTPREALQQMLDGTGLTVTQSPKDGALAVSRATSPNAARAIAQTDSVRPASKRGATVEDGPGGDKTIKLETFEVMGSKLLNMDKPRSRDDAQPYVVFERRQIEQSGAVNLEDFLKKRLSMNALGLQNDTATATIGSVGQVNLRGLGTEQTLVLVDGRRLPNISQVGRPVQPDLNGIPLAAIERIEVLPTTASGIYGGSATGGVVNVILRRDYAGAELTLTYENSFHTDAAIRRVDLSAGFTLEDGKTNLLLSASRSERNVMVRSDRDFVYERQLQAFANNPSLFLSPTSVPFLGRNTNIRSLTGVNLTLDDGTPLNSPFTFVPDGYQGGGSDNGAALVANAGRYDLRLSETPQATTGGRTGLKSGPTQTAVSLSARRQFSEKLQVFAEAAGSRSVSRFPNDSVLGFFTLPGGAPTNPFAQDIMVRVPLTGYESETFSENEMRRLAAGVIFRLPFDWTGEADYTWGQTRFRFYGGVGLSTAANVAVASGSLDVLRDTNRYPLNIAPYMIAGSSTPRPFESTLATSTLRLAGPAGKLPAGEIRLLMLVEHHSQEIEEGTQFSGISGITTLYPAREQLVRSAYVEASIPLLSGASNERRTPSLELQLAGRFDDYTTNGVTGSIVEGSSTPIVRASSRLNSTNPTASVRFQPTADIMLRASYGRGFLPPTVNQVLPVSSTVSTSIVDTRRGNSTVTLPPGSVTSGGNPNLRPEHSETWSAGLVVTPKRFSGFRLAVDFTRIEKTDNIATLSTAVLTANEDLFPGRVLRGPVPPGDPFSVGPIISIDNSLINVARAELQALDFTVDQRVEFAGSRLDLYAVATYQDYFRTQLLPNSPVIDNLGIAPVTRISIPLRWKGAGGAVWERGRLRLGWSFQYFHSHYVADPRLTSNVAIIAAQGNGGRVDAQLFHDVFASYSFPPSADSSTWRRLLGGIDLQIGVRNVFDRAPAFAVYFAGSSYYSDFGDPTGASYYLSLKKRF